MDKVNPKDILIARLTLVVHQRDEIIKAFKHDESAYFEKGVVARMNNEEKFLRKFLRDVYGVTVM